MRRSLLFVWAMMAVAVLPLLQGCSEEEVAVIPAAPDAQQPVAKGSEVYITADDFDWNQAEGASRSSLTIEDKTAKFSWTEGDLVGILPDQGAQVYFEIPEMDEAATDEERRKAEFDGGAWALKPTANYAGYYPFVADFDLDRTQVPVDYTGQQQEGTTTNHLGSFDFMGARPVTTNVNGGVVFDFDHVGALVLLRFTLPTADTEIKSVNISGEGVAFTVKGTYDLTATEAFTITPAAEGGTAETLTVGVNHTTTAENEEVTVYFMAAPIDLAGKSLSVNIETAGETLLRYTATGKTLEAGGGYLLEATELTATCEIDGTTAIIDVPEGVKPESLAAAAAEALAGNCTVIVVNGTLDADYQAALATALSGFANGTLVLDMKQSDDMNTDLVALVDIFEGHTVADDGTYEVYSPNGLYAWNAAAYADDYNKGVNLKLMTNITLPNIDLKTGEKITVTDGKPSGSNWTPVGNSSGNYSGTIDGNGKIISGIRINGAQQNVGFVANFDDGSIEDLTLAEVVVYNTQPYTGAFVGRISDEATISRCTVRSGSVTSTSTCVGAILGDFMGYSTEILNCTNNASVNGNVYVGGISGTGTSGKIVNCRNTGDVTGLGIVGGIAGDVKFFVSACVNEGTITGTLEVGGVCGNNGSNGSVVACANIGEVSGSGIVDVNKGNVIGCYTTQSSAGAGSGKFDACYYVSEDDAIDGTEGVADLNTEAIVTAMNNAIATWNESNNNACAYKWKVGTTNPELTAIAQE